MNKFAFLAIGCLLLTACGDDDAPPVSMNQPPAALPQQQSAVPTVTQNYPKALPQNIPNNIMMPQDTSTASNGYGQVPPAPATQMPSDPLYSGYSPSQVPPAGAEDKAINMNPVPDPGQQDMGQITVPTIQRQAPASTQPVTPAYPTANPVPNHPGMVYSPYGTQDQWVDVSSFPPGSKVKCPFTGRVFLTPAD
jgi:hypothetical protein